MKLTKKALALLLALTMVVGLLPAGALAMGVDSKEQIKTTETGEFAYADVSADNELSNENAVNTLTTLDGTVTTTETITGTNMENVFKLDLGVTTRDVKETVSVTPDAAVTLVLDMSGSMQSCIVCSMWEGEESVHSEAVRGQVFENWAPNPPYIGSHTFKGIGSTCVECWRDTSLHRHMVGHEFVSTLSQAQDAAISFVSTYSGQMEEGGNLGSTKRMVSLVVFSDYSKSRVVLSWVDAATAGGLQQIKAAIRGVTASGSTYTTRGMELGKDLLHDTTSLVDAKGAPITNKSMVLLTDGEPTLDKGQDSTFGGWPDKVTDATLRSKYVKDGQERIEYLAPIGIGMTLKDESIDLYSIYCGNLTENVELDNQSYAGINWMKDFSTAAYSAKDTSELEKAFKAINEEIEIATKAGKVTIPLHKYIVPADVSKLPAGVTYDAGANTLSWALGKVAADENGERDYSTSFNVKLDTAAVGFEEDTYYPTNLYTFLNYTVEQNGGSAAAVQTATFRVPQVYGALPQVDYTVNYYLKDRDGTPASEPTEDSYTDSDKLGAQVSAKSKTYDGYALDTNQQTAIVLGKDAEKNVINLYYHMTPVTVTVEHYFTTTTIDKDGNETTDEAPKLDDTVNTWGKAYYKGDSFTATPKADSVTLTFDKAASDKYENVKLDGDATIKLYYKELIDNRADAKVTVNTYVYNIDWALNDKGKYVSTASKPELYSVNGSISETMKHGQFYNAPNRVEEMKNAGYALDTAKSDKYEPVQLTGKQNTVLNYYYFNESNKPTETTVLVRHHYTTNTTPVNGGNGETVTVPAPGDEAAARVAGYVGETYTATPDTNYGGQKWTLDTTRPLGKELTADADANVIDVYYTRTVDGREKTTVAVNHYYQDWKNVISEDGQVAQMPDGDPKLETETVKDNVYVGGSYTATKAEKNGYTYSSGELTIAVLAESGNEISIFYDKKPALPEETSSTEVIHEYRTYKKYVDESGVVHGEYALVNTENGPGKTLTGSAGEWFDVATVKSFGDHDYEVTSPTGNPDSVRVTLNGANDTVTITYARYVDELTATSVKVVPVYTSYEKQIVNGKEEIVQVGESLIDESKAWTSTNPLYVGQNFTADHTLEQFKRDGYTFSHDATVKANPYQNVKLSANGDVIYLHFSNMDTPTDGRGESATIKVVHHYRFVDKYVDENGVYQEKILRDETVTDTTFEKYAGQTVTIASVTKPDGGCTLTAPIPVDYIVTEADRGQMVTIDLYYYGESNQTEKATLTVVHHYSNQDQNGNELLPEEQRTLTVEVKRDNGLHAGEGYTVSPEYKNIFALENITKRSFNGSDLTGFDVKLVKGENKVELYYAKTTDTRVKTTVTVIHQYAVLDANGNKRTAEGAVTDTFDTVALGAWVGNNFRAELRYANDANKLEYGLENASFVRTNADEVTTDPAVLLVDETSDSKLLQSVTLDESKAVITINYLRRVDTTPTQPPVDPPSDNYYRVTVEYRDLDGKTLADSYQTASIREGGSYDVTAQAAKAISGYAIDRVEGAVSGNLNGNLTVTVFYASESTIVDPVPPTTDKPGEDLTDIPEVDVPTTDLPGVPPTTDETVIVDENVPMGNLPQTGAVAQNVNVAVTLGALALSASLAAAGLGLSQKRKKEEEI